MLGALIVLIAGVLAVIDRGWSLGPTVILVVGVGAVLVVVADFPIATRFSADGIERRTLLRRSQRQWGDRSQLTRGRPSILPSRRRLRHAGLVYARPRQRVLLVAQSESLVEFERLVELLTEGGVPWVIDGVPSPSPEVPPTWLYRRKKWRPDGL